MRLLLRLESGQNDRAIRYILFRQSPIPEHAALQLGFDTAESDTREVTLADGSVRKVPMAGPLRVRFGNRYCDLSALVFGDEPLMGAVPMEMMDLVLHPASGALTVNPKSPYIPTAHAK
ncbi:MAG: hypothetical protein BECKG1743D_GA0114223_101711 [Candidatus Kentron sp. G]|nr:MAG: hypothetical protein BECKG1743F_GA0114225_101396 [Candidatus Kentron sp. G]VFN00122.1 MAG: hypothetical protein BECKG1743D_GA0114223_101711 [Candidatus Kentron sp. G]